MPKIVAILKLFCLIQLPIPQISKKVWLGRRPRVSGLFVGDHSGTDQMKSAAFLLGGAGMTHRNFLLM